MFSNTGLAIYMHVFPSRQETSYHNQQLQQKDVIQKQY
jgi:hypothetical protein